MIKDISHFQTMTPSQSKKKKREDSILKKCSQEPTRHCYSNVL